MNFHRAATLLALFAILPGAAGDGDLAARIAGRLAAASPGTRFGLVVADADQRDIVAILPDQRFIPASNTKIFTTAAAFATLTGLDEPDTTGGASVRLEGRDVVLAGHGDARLSSADDCAVDCLATLADAVAARARIVGDVIGDDSLFPDERWSPGMSWNNIPTRSGTGISALTLDDNELAVTVIPGAAGTAPTVAAPAYYTIDNRLTTTATGKSALGFDRAPNAYAVRLTGIVAAGDGPVRLRMGIDDPARYAAWRLAAMLRARGVRVTGAIGVRHRPPTAADDPATRGSAPVARPKRAIALATLTPPPIAADIVTINKVSQNLHAELLLRRIGLAAGSGSIADGLVAIRGMLAQAGVPAAGVDLSDGSGMSSYNRVSPRAMVTLLGWIARQPWGARWRASLPVGGVDGAIGRAFRGTALDGRLFAKTGTLNATNALAGYMVAKSGRTLTFALYANDVPGDAGATQTMYAALLAVAEGS
ncbi:D-alanyl-D-alanine carboxypeptidase/D-alanyl-D-alanine-endopeptidase [uncultured Sphingomonas sp.]|uniref:D-alanyl-D-alanine carboxypeptidase/D-alanyl-D-alanine endopeptidase n=1 Tax=uncultured Sphingomonas sp. TaxID=158754 RepID=UPI0035CAC496